MIQVLCVECINVWFGNVDIKKWPEKDQKHVKYEFVERQEKTGQKLKLKKKY